MFLFSIFFAFVVIVFYLICVKIYKVPTTYLTETDKLIIFLAIIKCFVEGMVFWMDKFYSKIN